MLPPKFKRSKFGNYLSEKLYVQTQLTSLINAIAIPGTILALKLLSYLPILILWGLFSFVFIFMPNTTVSYRSGLFAGIISGTIYYIVQSLYVSLQIGVSSYNAIYGSFAALPLFLVWLQITWVIVLIGSEISFFHQNLAFYQFNQHIKNLNFASKVTLAQQIMHSIIDRFKQAGASPYSAEELSIHNQLPISILQPILSELVDCQLLIKIDIPDDQPASYQPARDPSLLSDEMITEALENNGESYCIAQNQV
ncbi:YihY/virulence factor BrkB family protein [Bathymodiolus japonicus methanotrophic gill symbiont]|uniref:YihY/virulence factor BrkB family protein n=1 Tax=Bathymodiolus japonicus methanotrophic gill symbiont TaxID=113269 RepID=UPI001C8EE1F1|nr:YihY/virulence factor BrkB family protein [Bathymodiolus japonicus methanotrophic gill symbiont]